MPIRTAAAVILLLATATACGGGDDSDNADKPAASAERSASQTPTPGSPTVDCSDQSLSQADWIEHCSDQAGGKSAGLKFGQSYTWPDGLKVTVVEAKVFTDYDEELLESANPGETDFRLRLKVENTGKASVALDDLSTIIEGATNGGEAATTVFENGSEPLEGRLAPGVSAVKTDDNVLESKYGKKIVVTVQRASADYDLDFPEFTGEITN